MLLDGVTVMLIGMMVVFIMLMFIIGAINLSSWVIRYLEDPASAAYPPPSGAGGTGSNEGVVAAISAAITKFRKEE